jgi:hypothetical protein
MPAEPKATRRPLPNPFYVLLLAASALFVVTTFAYLVAPYVAERAARRGEGPHPAAGNLAVWLDRHGPAALGVEIAVMTAAGLLAMATDRWFPEKPARAKRPNEPRGA